MATIAFQPPGLAGSSSGAAQTASSWSRASAGSIATIGKVGRRSSRGRRRGASLSADRARASSMRLLGGNSCGMPCLWIAIRLKLRGAKGSPSTRIDPRRQPRRPAGLLGEDEVARLGAARSEMGSSRRSFFSTGRSQKPVAFLVDDAEHQLAAAQQLLHRMRDQPVAALLGARRGCGRRPRARSPCPCAPSPAAAAAALPPPSAPAPPRRARCRRRRRRAAP